MKNVDRHCPRLRSAPVRDYDLMYTSTCHECRQRSRILRAHGIEQSANCSARQCPVKEHVLSAAENVLFRTVINAIKHRCGVSAILQRSTLTHFTLSQLYSPLQSIKKSCSQRVLTFSILEVNDRRHSRVASLYDFFNKSESPATRSVIRRLVTSCSVTYDD